MAGGDMSQWAKFALTMLVLFATLNAIAFLAGQLAATTVGLAAFTSAVIWKRPWR
jgi:hypothetical protein